PEDLCQLCEELLRRAPGERPSGEEVRRRLAGGRPAGQPVMPLRDAPLVGRREQLEALAGAFARARAGRTVVVTVSGRSGAGKTALVKAFADARAEAGDAVVLAGRCYEQESVPYKGLDSLIDALARYLEGLPRAEIDALLPRDVASLARVFPVLGPVAGGRAARHPRGPSDSREARRRALAALRELLGRLGDRRPLLLTIDDLQWGDEDS